MKVVTEMLGFVQFGRNNNTYNDDDSLVSSTRYPVIKYLPVITLLIKGSKKQLRHHLLLC